MHTLRIILPVLFTFIIQITHALPSSTTDAASLLNPVELKFIGKSGYEHKLGLEKVPVIETQNVVMLGKLTALSFIDWISKNPNGVIALPTGKTPEYFIKFLKYYKTKWHDTDIQKELQHYGIMHPTFPETKHIKFVQLDEFYPLPSHHRHTYTQFVKKYYIELLNLSPENVLTLHVADQGLLKSQGIQKIFPDGTVDLTLLNREPQNKHEIIQKQALLEAQEFCDQHEKKIQAWGGIGFFLGGIGYEGHVAYNFPGTSLNSTTRLVQLNYPSSAQSAIDLGGIENARGKAALTIGFHTIQFNPLATIIIAASGEIKAPIVQKAIEEPANQNVPASLLQHHAGTRFYLTHGASKMLASRKSAVIENAFQTDKIVDPSIIDNALIEISLHEKIPLLALNDEILARHPHGKALLRSNVKANAHKTKTAERLKAKINKGVAPIKNQTFLHTSPHHDDVMLSYYPLMQDLIKNNHNYFSYMTSGFNSVTDHYIAEKLRSLQSAWPLEKQSLIFSEKYSSILNKFKQAFETNNMNAIEELDNVLALRNFTKAYQLANFEALNVKAHEVLSYFQNKTPGNPDDHNMQIFKGTMRESEVDRLWNMMDVPADNVYHLRSKFYTADDFKPLPSIEHDAKPLLSLLNNHHPNVVSVALDPEGTGPDTHYKVLQVVAQALQLHQIDKPLEVWGYRNVWHRFDFADATMAIPVSSAQMQAEQKAFMHCFSTQKNASFPSAAYDGPFSDMVVQLQANQKQDLELLLGKSYFENHPTKSIADAAGFVLIKQMPVEAFIENAAHLENLTTALEDVFYDKS